MRTVRTTRALTCGVAVAALVALVPPALAASAPGSDPAIAPTQPPYSYRNAIRESVWVLAPDSDGDGARDRVAVDLVRPRETDRAGERVPVVMHASPYYGLFLDKLYEGRRGDVIAMPDDDLDNYLVPRGYAYASVDMAGTSRSTGCADEGGRSDVRSVRAVVDWLNGRRRAVDVEGDPVVADWTNGKVGMIGMSYDGTLPIAVAATGVEGLETIVPQGAISSWYDYNRYQRLVKYPNYASWLNRLVASGRLEDVPCGAVNRRSDRTDGDRTGAYNPFWSERDYRAPPAPDASRVDASVYVMHGLQDFNVKGWNWSRWWAELGQEGVTRKLWLTRTGHAEPFYSDRATYYASLERWFASELKGTDNGILDGPRVKVEAAPREYAYDDEWPADTGQTVLHPGTDGLLGTEPGTGRDSFCNDPRQREAQAVTRGDNGARLLYATPPLTEDTRLSGTPELELGVRTRVPIGQVGVVLVDYGVGRRVSEAGEGIRRADGRSCYGASTRLDSSCHRNTARRLVTTPLQVLARGWARLDGAMQHDLTVEMTPVDTVVRAGHRLGVVVLAASRQWAVVLDRSRSRYTVDLGGTRLRLPADLPLARSGTPPGKAAAIPTLADLVPGTLPDPRRRQPPVEPRGELAQIHRHR